MRSIKTGGYTLWPYHILGDHRSQIDWNAQCILRSQLFTTIRTSCNKEI